MPCLLSGYGVCSCFAVWVMRYGLTRVMMYGPADVWIRWGGVWIYGVMYGLIGGGVCVYGLTGVVYGLTGVVYRLTGVMYGLIGVVCGLTGLVYGLTGVV